MTAKILPGIIIVAIPYAVVVGCHFLFRHYIPGVSFTAHRDGLGTALASYAGTTIAILIAALTFLISSKTDKLQKIRDNGYMPSVIIIYALTFVELGTLFFCGILLLSSLNEFMLPTIGIGIAAASFMHICLLVYQLYKLSHD